MTNKDAVVCIVGDRQTGKTTTLLISTTKQSAMDMTYPNPCT